jgi:hypothetical protein
VRAGSHLNAEYARDQMRALREKGWNACLLRLYGEPGPQGGDLWHVVVVGVYPDEHQANMAAYRYQKRTGRDYDVHAIMAPLLQERRDCP